MGPLLVLRHQDRVPDDVRKGHCSEPTTLNGKGGRRAGAALHPEPSRTVRREGCVLSNLCLIEGPLCCKHNDCPHSVSNSSRPQAMERAMSKTFRLYAAVDPASPVPGGKTFYDIYT